MRKKKPHPGLKNRDGAAILSYCTVAVTEVRDVGVLKPVGVPTLTCAVPTATAWNVALDEDCPPENAIGLVMVPAAVLSLVIVTETVNPGRTGCTIPV